MKKLVLTALLASTFAAAAFANVGQSDATKVVAIETIKASTSATSLNLLASQVIKYASWTWSSGNKNVSAEKVLYKLGAKNVVVMPNSYYKVMLSSVEKAQVMCQTSQSKSLETTLSCKLA